MDRKFDLYHTYICCTAGRAIASSTLYYALCQQIHGEVQAWPALYAPGDKWSYYWLVTYKNEVVKELAFVRHQCGPDRLQEQIEGPFKSEIWVDVEHNMAIA